MRGVIRGHHTCTVGCTPCPTKRVGDNRPTWKRLPCTAFLRFYRSSGAYASLCVCGKADTFSSTFSTSRLISWREVHRRPTTAEQRMRVVNLVQQAHELLDRFLKVDAQDSQGASEMVVELQELVDELRVLRPARIFRRQK